jgi:hypothetical protein
MNYSVTLIQLQTCLHKDRFPDLCYDANTITIIFKIKPWAIYSSNVKYCQHSNLKHLVFKESKVYYNHKSILK